MPITICPRCGTRNRVDERAGVLQPVCGKCGAKLDVTESVGGPAAAAANGKPIEVSDDTLPKVLKEAGDRPVLVDSWAPWCPPCRAIASAIDQLARDSAGRYLVAKLNVDENQRTAAQFNIRSIPTLLIFKNGRLVDQIIGAQPKQAIAARLAAQI